MAKPNTGRNSKSGKNGWKHETVYDRDDNTRFSYDIKPDKSGGWSIKDVHGTDQNKSKGSNNHKND